MNAIFSACLSIGAAWGQGPLLNTDGQVVPFPLQDQGVPLSAPATYDALTIAEPLGRAAPVKRRALGGTQDQQFEVERVRVTSSACFAAGSTVNVLVPWRPYVAPEPLPVGKRVLLIATKSRDGFLNWPLFGGADGAVDYAQYPSESSSETLGLAYFYTNQQTLPGDERPEWRLLASLAACIRGTATQNVKAVARMLRCELAPINNGRPKEPDEYFTTFVQAVANERPYHRALVYETLNLLDYYGTGDLFVQAVLDSANDPDAFPDGVGFPAFWEDISSVGRQHVKHRRYSNSDAVSLAVAAQNPRVATFLIGRLANEGSLTAPLNQSLLLPKLDDPNEALRWTIVKVLSAWHNDPAHAPQKPIEDHVVHRMTYPGLSECVSYWKDFLRNH